MIKTISLNANEEQRILVDKYNVKITNFTSDDVYISAKPNISADKDDVKKILSYQSDGLSNLFERIFFIKSNVDGNVQIETADDMSHFFKYQNMTGGGTTNTYTKSEIDIKFNDVGYSIGLSVDPLTYLMTLDLKNSKGDILSTQNVDLPIESMIVSANYENGMLNLILQSGETLNVDISSIINGLVNNDFTIAGIDMKDNITADELRTALNIIDYNDTELRNDIENLQTNKVGFTDYATSSKAGVVKISYGLSCDKDGKLTTKYATEDDIKNESSQHSIISPGNSKYLMSSYGITSKTQITDMEKQLAGLENYDDTEVRDMISMSTNPVFTVFVDGTNGSDDNDGSTKAKAFKTLDKAVKLLSKVSTLMIYIASGTYDITSEQFLGADSISSLKGKNLYLTNYNRTSDNISDVVIRGAIRAMQGSTLYCSFITFESVEFSGWKNTYNAMFYLGEMATAYFASCVINNNHYEAAIAASISRLNINIVTINNNSSNTNKHSLRVSHSVIFINNLTDSTATADVYYKYPSLIMCNRELTYRGTNTGLTVVNGQIQG